MARAQLPVRVAIAASLAVSLALAGCSSGGSHTSLANFCRDTQELSGVSGTDPATLQHAADVYRKLGGEVPDAKIKADLTLLADSEIKVKNGDASSVNGPAADSANNGFAAYVGKNC